MEKEMDKNKIERYKATAKIFLKKNVPAYVKDTKGNLYFCDIIRVDNDSVIIKCFGPEQRKDKSFEIYWPLVVDFDKYQSQEDMK